MLRGWDYPHLDNDVAGRENGNDWIASGSDWGGMVEYWKLFQSGQFLHLLGLYGATDPDYVNEVKKSIANRTFPKVDPAAVRGGIDIVSLLYTITEVHAFAAGLVAEGIYTERVSLQIQLVNASGYVLTAEPRVAWWLFCQNTQTPLGREWEYAAETLVSSAGPLALQVAVWFYERFGWQDPNVEQLQRDQEKLLQRRL